MEEHIFLSRIIGKKILDAQGQSAGKIIDVFLALREEFQPVEGIVVKGKTTDNIPVSAFKSFNPPVLLMSSSEAREHVHAFLQEDYVFLKRDILDKQIIDTEGKKIVRVNDLQIVFKEGQAFLVASDVGVRGILRRLGMEWFVTTLFAVFRKTIPDALIPWNVLEPIDADLSHLRLKISHKKLEKLHPSDIASIAAQLSAKERVSLFERLDKKVAAETLHELEPEAQVDIVEGMDREHASDILEVMPSDEAADVIGDLSKEQAKEFLSLMEKKEADEVEELLQYHDDTAGGFMTNEFVAFTGNAECQEVIERLRMLAPSAETIYYLYIVDDNMCLEGVFTLRDLTVSPPETHIEQIMRKDVVKVRPEATKEDVAEAISKYNLLALPVVDKENRMLGIVTVDDVVDFIVPSTTRKKQIKL